MIVAIYLMSIFVGYPLMCGVFYAVSVRYWTDDQNDPVLIFGTILWPLAAPVLVAVGSAWVVHRALESKTKLPKAIAREVDQ